MQKELKDNIENLLKIKLPNNYDNLHDLNFLLKLEEIGNIAKTNLEQAKNDILNNHLKTFDEVLDYIPNNQYEKYKICPNYYHLFLNNIQKFDLPFQDYDENYNFLNFLKNYKKLNIIDGYIYDICHGFHNKTTYYMWLFYHENDTDFLTKLKTVNQYCDKFLIDTVNKEIHPNLNSQRTTLTNYTDNFNYLCNYQNIEFNNDGLKIVNNKLINQNIFISQNTQHKELHLNITHIFDIQTNQYLNTKTEIIFDGGLYNDYRKPEKFITRSMIYNIHRNENFHFHTILKNAYKEFKDIKL